MDSTPTATLESIQEFGTPHRTNSLRPHLSPVTTSPNKKVAAMSPATLTAALDTITSQISVEQWKNIPKPVCEATTALFNCVEMLKRFTLYQDGRFANMQSKCDQNNTDSLTKIIANQRESTDTMDKTERFLKESMRAFEDKLEKYVDAGQKKLTLDLSDNVQAHISKSQSNLKAWAESKVDDKIAMSEKKEDKKIQLVKDMFNVPSLIGATKCNYKNFTQYVEKMQAMQENFIQKFQDSTSKHATNDKSFGVLMEKMGYIETHFIDVRHELTKKFEDKYA